MLLGICLLVLFIASVLVFSAQWSARHTASSVLRETLAVDSFHRAYGLTRLFVSRIKKEVRLDTDEMLTLPEQGEEGGKWADREYVLGWNRGAMARRPLEAPLVVWIRFLDDHPPITHRFDLKVRLPVLLDALVVDELGYSVENLDPRSRAARDRAFASRSPGPGDDPSSDALVEVLDSRLTAGLTAGTDRDVVWNEQSPTVVLGLLPSIRDCLAGFQASRTIGPSRESLEAARQALSEAASMAEPIRSKWEPGCRFRLADEMDRFAGSMTGTNRKDILVEAGKLLDPMIEADPESCGAPRATWLRARIAMRLLFEITSPADRLAEKGRWSTALQRMADRAPLAPIHRRTDICRAELPSHFETAWKARALLYSVLPGNPTPALVSYLVDGKRPITLLESVTPGWMFRWSRDGGSVFWPRELATGGTELWSLASDGSSLEILASADVPNCGGQGPSGLPAALGASYGGFQLASGLQVVTVPVQDGARRTTEAWYLRDQCVLGMVNSDDETLLTNASDEIAELVRIVPGEPSSGTRRVRYSRWDLASGRSVSSADFPLGDLAGRLDAHSKGCFFTREGREKLSMILTLSRYKVAIALLDLTEGRLQDVLHLPDGLDSAGMAMTLRYLPSSSALLALVDNQLFLSRLGTTGLQAPVEIPKPAVPARLESFTSSELGESVVLVGKSLTGPPLFEREMTGLDPGSGTSWPIAGQGSYIPHPVAIGTWDFLSPLPEEE